MSQIRQAMKDCQTTPPRFDAFFIRKRIVVVGNTIENDKGLDVYVRSECSGFDRLKVEDYEVLEIGKMMDVSAQRSVGVFWILVFDVEGLKCMMSVVT